MSKWFSSLNDDRLIHFKLISSFEICFTVVNITTTTITAISVVDFYGYS